MLSSKWWNNKASDIKLAYLYSTIKMMHGPINLKMWFKCVMTKTIRFYSNEEIFFCNGILQTQYKWSNKCITIYVCEINVWMCAYIDKLLSVICFSDSPIYSVINDGYREFGIINSTIQTIRKNRTKINSALEQNGSRTKLFRRSEQSDVDEALLKWFKQEKWPCTSERSSSHNFCSS